MTRFGPLLAWRRASHQEDTMATIVERHDSISPPPLPVHDRSLADVSSTGERRRVAAAAIAGYAFDGVDIMVLALALPYILKDWGITMVQGGLIVTAMLIGTSLGGYIFGPIADRYGRKRTLVWCISFFAVATGLCGFAQDYIQLSILRLISGLGLGAEWAIGGTLLAEFYPANQRGKANSWMQSGWPIGYAIALGFQVLLVPAFGWRAMFFAGTSALLVAAYIQLFVPESPVWRKAQDDRRNGIVAAQAQAPRIVDLFRGRYLRTFVFSTVICSAALMAYWAVNTWLPTLLTKERGLNMKQMTGMLLALQVACLAGYAIGGVVADKIGKRMLIVASALLSAVSFYIWLGVPTGPTAFFALAVVHYIIASAFWATLASFLAEQFPTSIRALGVSSSYSTGRLFSVLVPIALGAIAMTTGLIPAIIFAAMFYLIAMFGAVMLRDGKELA
jgi:MFS family permease